MLKFPLGICRHANHALQTAHSDNDVHGNIRSGPSGDERGRAGKWDGRALRHICYAGVDRCSVAGGNHDRARCHRVVIGFIQFRRRVVRISSDHDVVRARGRERTGRNHHGLQGILAGRQRIREGRRSQSR